MESLASGVKKIKIKIGQMWPQNLLWLRRKKKQYWRKFRGSQKDPLFCLMAISVILFGIVSFSSYSFSEDINSFFFTQDSQGEGEVFLIPGTKVNESPDLSLIQKNSLAAISPPITVTPQILGALVGGVELEEIRREIIEYVVKEGDSLWSIAEKFNISIDTIVGVNNVTSALIRPGQKLLILPVSGVMHLVGGGDTVSGLAEKYKTEADKIIAFNNLGGNEDIFVGEVLIIPDGQMPSYSSIEPVDSGALSRLSTNNFYGQSHDYPYGQCTWWVAQKRAIPGWGHAKDWLDNAQASGYPVCRNRYCLPQFGAVISLKGHRIYQHVGYVEQVKGDKVIFSEMNYIGWGRMNYRTLTIGDPLIRGYIY